MNVLSLCDGMSCCQIVLKELGIKVDKYFASEIDKNAIKVTNDNFPNTIQLGNVNDITLETLKSLPKIDFVCFGSPCRSLSSATAGHKGYNDGLKGISGLFFTCCHILNWIKTHNNTEVKFFVENVNSSKKEDLKIMSDMLEVEPILINSANFSAQERKRLYWTNIKIDFENIPTNDSVMNDILEDDVDEKFFYNVGYDVLSMNKKILGNLHINGHDSIKRIYNTNFKSPTLTSCRGGNRQVKVLIGDRVRKLTPTEYRRLQTIPDWYKTNVSNSTIYNICGDGWNIETIKFLFKNLLV